MLPFIIDQYVHGGVHFVIFMTALRLGLFEAIAEKAVSEKTLSSQLNVPEPELLALLEVLAAMGLLKRTRTRKYVLTRLARGSLLRGSRHLQSYATYLEEHVVPALGELTRALIPKRERSPKHRQNRRLLGVHGTFKKNRMVRPSAKHVKLYGEFLAYTSASAGMELARNFRFSGVKTIADLGGNDGAFLEPVLLRHRALFGVIIDLPAVRKRAVARFRASGLARRFKFVGKNFLKGPLPRADIYLCGHVLHDWSEPIALLILRRIFKALPPGGQILLHERVRTSSHAPNRLDVTRAHFELVLKGAMGERTDKEYKGLLRDAGFTNIRIRPGRERSYIMARRPRQ